MLTALVARTDGAQSLPRIDAIVVLIAVLEAHAVTPDVLRINDRDVVGNRCRVYLTRAGQFVDADGAGAFGAQPSDRIDARVAVIPAHGQLPRAGLGDLKR